MQQAKYQDALPILERAVELAPNLPEARRNLAYTRFFLGDTKLAFDNFIETIKLAPEQLASWNVMIDALSIYGDSDGVRSTLCELPDQLRRKCASNRAIPWNSKTGPKKHSRNRGPLK